MLAADLFPLDGFVGQHDPLAVRVLLLEQGRQRVAIAVIDLTSIFDEVIASFKATISALAGVAADHVIVCASHTFSAPHLFVGHPLPANASASRSEAALQAFDAALRTATAQAVANQQPARLGCGSGVSRIGVNRDVSTAHGWWLGADDSGFADPSVGVLRIDGRNGRPLALLMNVSVQPSVMDSSERAQGGRLISSDLAGAATRHLEARYPSAVGMFLIGAAGDQSPVLQANRHTIDASGRAGRVDLHEAGFVPSDLLGERLGDSVSRIADSIRTADVSGLDMRRIRLPAVSQARGGMPSGPVLTHTFQSGASVEIPLAFIRIGGLVLVGLQPELAANVGAQIRARSPFPATFIVTMVDGAAKYLPDAASYERLTDEARSSSYVRGTAEATAESILATLMTLYAESN